MLLNSRSRLLKIFYGSGNLDWFLGYGGHRKLDATHIKQLKELILWGDGKYDTKQNPPVYVARHATIDEAVYEKAQDASTYITLTILRRQEARKQAEKRREQEKRNQEARENQRQALEAQKEQIEKRLGEL